MALTPDSVSTKVPRLVLSPAVFDRAHDGDSFYLNIPGWKDLFPGQSYTPYCRAARCNAAELSSQLGKNALIAVQAWFATHEIKRVEIFGREKYGRVLLEVIGTDRAFEMVKAEARLSDYILNLPGSAPTTVARQLAPPRYTSPEVSDG